MTDDPPLIHIRMPSVEDFDDVIAMVRATGAVPAGSHQFVIEGPMTTTQVAALLRLCDWDDDGTFDVYVEPDPEPDPSLREDADDWYNGRGKYAREDGPRYKSSRW
jgi:hypothetical protein